MSSKASGKFVYCNANQPRFAIQSSRLINAIIILVCICNLHCSSALLKCFTTGMFRFSKSATIHGSSYGPDLGTSSFDFPASKSLISLPQKQQQQSSLKTSWLDNNKQKYNNYLLALQQKSNQGYAQSMAIKKSLLQSKLNKAGLLKNKLDSMSLAMLSPFYLPNSATNYNNQQNNGAQMRPVFSGYSSPGYQVQGDLNVAPFSIPSQYNPPENLSNEGWSKPQSFSTSASSNQQQQQMQMNGFESNKQPQTNNPINSNPTKSPSTTSTTKTPNNQTNKTSKPSDGSNSTTTTKKPKK